MRQSDSGLFETNLRDERYLPFEGAGAISRWRLEIPNDVLQFDMESITDVVMHIRYTCREAGHLKQDAVTSVTDDVLQTPDNLMQLFSLNYDFANAWHAFTSAASDAQQVLNIQLDRNRFHHTGQKPWAWAMALPPLSPALTGVKND